MKIRIKENVIVESRFYKAGEYVGADIPEADLSVILKSGFGESVLPGDESDGAEKSGEKSETGDGNEDKKDEGETPPAVFPAEEWAGKGSKEVIDALPGFNVEELRALAEAEFDGRRRKGILKEIKVEISNRR